MYWNFGLLEETTVTLNEKQNNNNNNKKKTTTNKHPHKKKKKKKKIKKKKENKLAQVGEADTKPLRQFLISNSPNQFSEKSEKLNTVQQTSHRNYKWGLNADESISKTRW